MFCSDCQSEKLIEEFTANRGKSIRRCKLCSIKLEKLQKRKYYERNIQLAKIRTTANQADRIAEWALYLQNKYSDPFCECCNKKLFWPGKGKSGSVHFDHRHGGIEVITGGPTTWMRCRRPTLDNIAIFESCDFGILCDDCNRCLPTMNRGEWLKKALEYYDKTKTRHSCRF